MDYEEKYKEALSRAKKLYGKYCINNVLESIFPELKESEDEKIRKELISFVNNDGWKFTKLTKEEKESWITWLEKQDEHHIACSEEQMKVLDEVLNFAANHENSYWNNYIFETLNNFIRQLKKLKV